MGFRLDRLFIWMGSGLFLSALAVSALVVPQLRLLHSLQALIYVAVVALGARNSPWGFGAGLSVATVWIGFGLLVSHLIQAGAGQFWTLLRTGHLSRPDTLMVLVGSVGHFLLIIGCIAGFVQLNPKMKQWGQFFGGGMVALAYFALILVTTAPH